MLALTLFTVLSLPHLSHQISCYDCSNAPNQYQYLISTNRIPPEIENCPLKANQTSCFISLKWEFTFVRSELNLIADPKSDQTINNQHTLSTNTLLTGYGLTQQWQHVLEYRCATDQCNNLTRFKLLLSSLTFTSNFSDIADLLKPQNPFTGSWCLLAKNRTDMNCSDPSTINPRDCQQCFTVVTTEAGSDKICASCFTTDLIEQESLEREVLFSMVSRTSTETWKIFCRAPDCNGRETGVKIRQKSTISFDFDQFLGVPASNERMIASIFLNGLVLLLTFVSKSIY